MKLWVDYTNWKGRREWREIEPWGTPPRIGPYNEEGKPTIQTWVIDVRMVDRNYALRTLRLDHIHGFRVSDKPNDRGALDDCEDSQFDKPPGQG